PIIKRAVSVSISVVLIKNTTHSTFSAISREIRIFTTYEWFKTEPRCLNFSNGSIFVTLVSYLLKLHSFVQYFSVFGKSIFLHFPSILNKFTKFIPCESTLKCRIHGQFYSISP
ncbi:hypothetical protein T08_12623, partial [Trichinella sp. T8]